MDSSVLLVTLSCSEEGFPTVQYRIIVQVLNENDNKPRFLEESVVAQNISELAEVDSVIFSAQALDLDGDTLMYVIDRSTADSRYFRIDLPNSGKVLLSRALDYESRQELEVVIHAVEMTTRERQRTSARVRVSVLDGDDQYPQFLPCHFMSHDGLRVCVSPTYLANITEGEEQMGHLVFSPGPIFAEDGDRGIMAPIAYSLLSGPDSERFQIDNVTGCVTLTPSVGSRLGASILTLRVMASQVGDPRKFSVAEVGVRVLAANQHAPHFGSAQYQAFVQENPSPAALVSTYNGRVLSLTPSDRDFPNSSNPQIRLILNSLSNHSQLFQITQSGLLIARANQLQALEHYFLQVIARDEESGETANCTVSVKVLAPGQAAPLDPSEPRAMLTLLDVPVVVGGLGALSFLVGVLLFLFIRAVKSHRQQQQQLSQTSLMTEKHPSVSLKWFQPVNPGKPAQHPQEQCYQNAGFSETPGDESASQERGAVTPPPSGQSSAKEPSKVDGQPGKQHKKAPAVAVISPGNQCAGRSVCRNSREEAAELVKPMPRPHEEAAATELQSTTGGLTQAIITKEEGDSPPGRPPLAAISTSQPDSDQPLTPDPSREAADRQDGPGLWPDPPLLSRLPIVVEVNEEVVEPEGEQDGQCPPMGSGVITPGSLMQLLEDSIEC
ncbi:cadherin-related family member 5-like [Ascaphus truei]|uniref:cadherin-related family member 5-like n=1 Tax=Ascaphus truei TaxID=8439 RepID=UPI003F5AB919